MKAHLDNFIFIALILAGVAIGGYLVDLKTIPIFKLFNIVGLFYDILGLFILSELIANNEKYQSFIVSAFTKYLMYAHVAIPIGISLIGLFIFFMDSSTSSMTVSFVGLATLGIMFIPFCIVEDVVFRNKFTSFDTPSKRSRFLGGFLLFIGLLLQFYAAILDLEA